MLAAADPTVVPLVDKCRLGPLSELEGKFSAKADFPMSMRKVSK